MEALGTSFARAVVTGTNFVASFRLHYATAAAVMSAEPFIAGVTCPCFVAATRTTIVGAADAGAAAVRGTDAELGSLVGILSAAAAIGFSLGLAKRDCC